MEFMGIGPLELLLILIIAFLVVGPRKLPEIARGLGKGLHGVRKAWFEFTTEVSKEVKDISGTEAKEEDNKKNDDKGD